jgi:MFS family permease
MSAQSVAAGGRPSSVRRVVVASLVGTSLEWYDFFIYGTAAALVFNQLFFPSFDPLVGTLLAFTTYAVGFVARPLGGIVFGHYGDKVGRKNVLVITLLLMGIATFAIGLLPTYDAIGAWAPILLVTLRFLQGLGLGGEWGGAVLMTLESGDRNKRGLNASWPQVGVPVGLLLANGVLSLMGAVTEDDAFLSWGWRVPFLLSGVLVLVGLWIRMQVAESPAFAKVESSHEKVKAPIVDVLRNYPRQVLLAVGARLGVDVAFYIFVLFITTYVTTYLKLPSSYALNAVLIAAACQVVTIPLFGALSDRYGRRLRPARHRQLRPDRALRGRRAGVPRRDVRPTGVLHRGDVPHEGPLQRRLHGVPARRRHRRGARPDHRDGAADQLLEFARRVRLLGSRPAGHDRLRGHRQGDREGRHRRRRRRQRIFRRRRARPLSRAVTMD